MVIIPIATVIPETITALIWGYRGKDTLECGFAGRRKDFIRDFLSGAGVVFNSMGA